jgi:Heparinase II/III-like protein/Heparinase II/III N-terminus
MSAAEVGWRATSSLRLRLGPHAREERAVDWEAGPWPVLVRSLAADPGGTLVEDAGRIADGELRFWGRGLRVDPHALPWRQGPFAREAAADAPWARDPKCWWELQRQQHLFPLAAGGQLAGQPAWTRLAVEQVLDWIATHPTGGPGWGSAYEAAHRLVSWACALPLAAPLASPAERAEMAAAFARSAALVRERPSRFSSANNHRLAELAGLLAFEALSVERSGWARAWGELEREVDRQTFADGGSREQAAGYFVYVLEIVWFASLLAHAVGQELGALGERAARMLEWLRAVADADGEPPPVGDDAEDRLLRVDYFAPRRAAVVAARLDALLGGAPALFPPASPAADTDSRALRDSGYVVLRGRLETESVRLVLDTGVLGFGSLAAHGHADALAVTVDVGAETLLRDAGTGSYLAAAGRDRFRLTSAHNSVCIDGEGQAQPLGPHIWGRRFGTAVEALVVGAEVEYVRVSHDGYRSRRSRAVHTRSVTYLKPDVALVLDRVTAARECTAELVWQTMPGRTLDAPGAGSALAVAASPAASRSDGTGPFSPRYTWIEDAPRATFRTAGRDIVFASALVLSRPGTVGLEVEHDDAETVVVLDAGGCLRIVERWAGGPAHVEAL